MKRYANNALFYSILAMVGGVFYREFTKLSGFVGETTLSHGMDAAISGMAGIGHILLGVSLVLLLLQIKRSVAER